jgi:hypothetical protein
MASGDTLCTFTALNNEPPSSNFATLDTRNGHPVLDFDATTDESAVFSAILPRHYGGGGITVYLHVSASGITSGNYIFDVAFERIGDGQQDVDSDGFAAAQSLAATAVPGTDGHVDIVSIAFTNGAQMDSIAVGELFRLKVTRDADNGSDTAAADIELHAVEIKET